jgi:hypothetical protein
VVQPDAHGFSRGPLFVSPGPFNSFLELDVSIVGGGPTITAGTYLFESGNATAETLAATPEPSMLLLWATTAAGPEFITRRWPQALVAGERG